MNEQTGSAILSEPPPAVDAEWAAEVLRTTYGVTATVEELRSERDRNYLATAADGRQLVVKVSHSAEDRHVLDMENSAMAHVARVDPTLAIPRLLAAPDGRRTVTATAPDGRAHAVRIVTVLPGQAADTTGLPVGFAEDLGRWAARLTVALQGFFDPAGGRSIEWDPRRVSELRTHLPRIAPDRRDLIGGLLDRLDRSGGLLARSSALPAGVLHADVTMSNVLVDDAAITGLIDFGDMHHTARVCDLAITLTSLLRVVAVTGGDPWQASGDLLQGYQRAVRLQPAEVDLLGELVLARLTATVLISAWRAPDNPDNLNYLTGLDAGSWLMLDQWTALSPEELSERLHRRCGTARLSAAQQPDADLLRRRRKVLGGDISPLFYRDPLHVVRGDGPWLITSDGRRYLDAYNNVAVVGHEHPVVVQAISQQASILNTNSRYLHAHVIELGERLVATMPEALDTCLFVNSGSEATDLAWRLATLATGHSGGIVTNCSYHGVSAATSPLSSNTWPAGSSPEQVAAFEPPYVLRDGTTAGHGDALTRVRAAVDELAARGQAPALLAIDPMLTSAGVLEPEAGFIVGLVDGIHAAGGLFLADEVQAGFGRGGRNLWRFQDFGVVPDLVTLGKPMGNGHPIAAVVTRRELVDRLASVDEFFSTFGGNPVACAAGLAVLDVIEAEQLVDRARTVGDHLRAGVVALSHHHPAIGAVRGQGLIAGIELRGVDGPSRALTLDVVERLRELGVLVGSTGPLGTVLKVRPPLVWQRHHADLFLDCLDRALTDAMRT